ncbi:sulfate ABC transporter permease subunit CysT [Glycocaulis profundi]|nr:sulfate ABC transporter permease subunit CysT [Glycocaulis profundi]
MALPRFRQPSILPGFGPALGFTVFYLSAVALIPLGVLVLRAAGFGLGDLWSLATDERTLAALRLSFGASLIAALINLVFGVLLAWVLVRYRFPGKRVLDAMVDLPFALPTAVAGIALTTIYAPNGWIGQFLEPLGLTVVFTPAGVVIALVFISLPFVVRTVQPVLADLDHELEEAAASLGASRLQTFRKVILPALTPSVMTGFALAFARSIGEYGSVIFIAGNIPYVSEIAPLLIVIRLEEFDYDAATAIALIILIISFAALFAINLIQAWTRRRHGHVL